MKAKLAAAFIVVAVAAFLFGWSFGPQLAPQPAANVPAANAPRAEIEQFQTASIMLDYGDGTVKTYEVEFLPELTLFESMKTLSVREGFEFKYQPPGQYGILIDQIGPMAGGTDGKYWLWYENNRMGQVASDAYKLQNGDVIEWKFVNLKM